MLTVEEALARCVALTIPRRTERIPLHAAAGRVLAVDIAASSPQPRWDNAAMDGYAIRFDDCDLDATEQAQTGCDLGAPDTLPPAVARLTVIETIQAGAVGERVVQPGEAARIMTGAPMPAGADTVVMRENAFAADGEVSIHGVPRKGQHIRLVGEELQIGDPLLSAGEVLTPARIGLLASQGIVEVIATVRPKVGVIATGDEVQPPGRPLKHGQIWSSNTASLLAMVAEAGAEGIDCGIAPDTLEGTRAAFQRALDAGCDLILSTGGVSVGDFDMVKDALGDLGAEMLFWKVRAKPGKPLALGEIGGVPAFGLPGNPVSCLVNFLQFVRPVLRKALGDPRPYLPALKATMAEAYRKRHSRAEFVRVTLSIQDGELIATPTGSQSSAWISSMARADGLLLVGTDATGAEAGEAVWVQPLHGGGFLSSDTPAYPW